MKFRELVLVYEVDPHLVPFLEDELDSADVPGYVVRFRVYNTGVFEVAISSASPKAVAHVQKLVEKAVKDAQRAYLHARRLARLLDNYHRTIDLDLEVIE